MLPWSSHSEWPFGPQDKIQDKTTVLDKCQSNIPPLPDIVVNADGVQKLPRNLKPDKTAGPEIISPRVLRELALVICKLLVLIFKNSIDTGVITTQWKSALVTRVFKKGD